jgi:hypothetical protein
MMAEQEMPKEKQQSEREYASPREQQRENERTSTPDLGEREAARRQARQDPLQRRDR